MGSQVQGHATHLSVGCFSPLVPSLLSHCMLATFLYQSHSSCQAALGRHHKARRVKGPRCGQDGTSTIIQGHKPNASVAESSAREPLRAGSTPFTRAETRQLHRPLNCGATIAAGVDLSQSFICPVLHCILGSRHMGWGIHKCVLSE